MGSQVAFPDYMIDFETGGLNCDQCPAIQIAAVQFNLQEQTIGGMFKASILEDQPRRRWDAGTQRFWENLPDIYQNIVSRAEPSRDVFEKLVAWVGEDGLGPYTRRFWAKPTHFDWGFLNSYLADLDLPQPFHFREACDVNSYIRGRGHWDGKAFWDQIEPVGEAHDALNDCLYQIRGLFEA